jgi:hypothetical protein
MTQLPAKTNYEKAIKTVRFAFAAMLILLLPSAKANSNLIKNDSSTYAQNILKFAPLSFIPYNLLPCFSIDVEHRHSTVFSSQFTTGFFIANSSNLNRFPGFKAAYEARLYMTRNTNFQGYFAFNTSFVSQNAITTLRFQNENSINDTNTAYANESANIEFTIHRDFFVHTVKLGIQASISSRLAIDAYVGLGIMHGHNIYFKENKDDKMISTVVNPLALSQVQGDFWCPTFPCNIKICYML